MQVLVTAGNTQTPIDRVRCITNIFTGRTGGRLAQEAANRGHRVTLLTSHPQVLQELQLSESRLKLEIYRTFDDLHSAMAQFVSMGQFDAIIHSAAVSDYSLGGVYRRDAEDQFRDVSEGKVSSAHAELWLRLVPTPKLVDQIRQPWGFRGTLVKFKLEVNKSDEELAAIARRSRRQSDADFLVANTLESYQTSAIICDRSDAIEPVLRADLPRVLWDRIEARVGTS